MIRPSPSLSHSASGQHPLCSAFSFGQFPYSLRLFRCISSLVWRMTQACKFALPVACSSSFHVHKRYYIGNTIVIFCQDCQVIFHKNFVLNDNDKQHFLTFSMNCWGDISELLEWPVGPVIIFMITTPKLNMSNFFDIKLLSMYSGGKYPLHDTIYAWVLSSQNYLRLCFMLKGNFS